MAALPAIFLALTVLAVAMLAYALYKLVAIGRRMQKLHDRMRDLDKRMEKGGGRQDGNRKADRED